MGRPDYLELTYSAERLPRSDYPTRLTDWLVHNVPMRPGRFLDVGCGRGEYLKTFAARGFDVAGVDGAASAQRMAEGARIDVLDVERDPLPHADGSLDCIFSKSVIEHLQRPNGMLAECFRVLRPGGTAVIMTPSWRHCSKVFYEDYTHVSPFTVNGLTDALMVAGFDPVHVRLFWQLPFLWKSPALHPIVTMLSWLPVPYRPWNPAPWPEKINTLIRFSKEVMLLGVAQKPLA